MSGSEERIEESRNPPPNPSQEMNITVKAAQFDVCIDIHQHLYLSTVIKRLHEVPLPLAVEFLQGSLPDNLKCTRTQRAIIRNWFCSGECVRHVSPFSVTLRVEPTLTIGALKSLLKSEPWIPKENLVLVKRKVEILDDDFSTLLECGFKGRQGSLLACMGGSFPVTVLNTLNWEKFSIPISSCFETLGEMKKKIHHSTGILPEEQGLRHLEYSIEKRDNTPLVAFGFVKPYLSEMGLVKPYLCETGHPYETGYLYETGFGEISLYKMPLR